jgi:hypothetical protein
MTFQGQTSAQRSFMVGAEHVPGVAVVLGVIVGTAMMEDARSFAGDPVIRASVLRMTLDWPCGVRVRGRARAPSDSREIADGPPTPNRTSRQLVGA